MGRKQKWRDLSAAEDEIERLRAALISVGFRG